MIEATPEDGEWLHFHVSVVVEGQTAETVLLEKSSRVELLIIEAEADKNKGDRGKSKIGLGGGSGSG